ncbi:MAG: DUF3015 domain-containing protein [Gammaproteobacteria bacterium]|nr:MAG: DUF3015 domain-containing protein [Gammaproteobacteria bacterium]
MKHTIKILFIAGILSTMSACTAITEVSSSTSSTTDTVTPDVTLNNFIDKRYDAIRKDAARGQGENIEALSQLMGTHDADSLASWMKQNYEQLFGQNTGPEDLASKLELYHQHYKS